MNRPNEKMALRVIPNDVTAVGHALFYTAGSEQLAAHLMEKPSARPPPPMEETVPMHGDDVGHDHMAALKGDVVHRGDHYVDPDLVVDRRFHDGESQPE